MRAYDAYSKYAALFPGREVIDQPLWDTATYTSAATTQLRFFNVTRATLDLSNMRVAGQLPFPEELYLRSVRVFVKNFAESINVVAAGNIQTGAADNINRLISTAALTLTIGNKNYGIYPLHTLPAGGGAQPVVNAVNNILIGGGAVDYAQTGRTHVRNNFALAVPIMIKSQQQFFVDIVWAAALTLTRNVNIQVVLDGDLIRGIQ